MAELHIHRNKIISNIKKISSYLNKRDIQWTLVTKILCGNKPALEELLNDPSVNKTHSIGDSRISSLKTIKRINPGLVTMYIKPAAMNTIKSIVDYADISMNTSFKTIKALNDEAKRQKKQHRVIIMIELGELREGVIRERVLDFYKEIFKLPYIKIEGIGTNLGCMFGIEPTYDKLIQLSLYKQLLENVFNRELNLISGGSSITLPLISQKKIPKSINHFRLGESVFCGTSPINNKSFLNMHIDCFEYFGNIIELEEKETLPEGIIGEGSVGHALEFHKDEIQAKTYKAIVDYGVLDVDSSDLIPKNKSISFVGTTSDLTVFDIGDNLDKNNKTKHHVGGQLAMIPSYMGTARLMNSKFIEKIIK